MQRSSNDGTLDVVGMSIARESNREWNGEWTATALIVLLCTGISASNALELVLLILMTFKRRDGLYFWSLLITSIAVLPYSIGYFIGYIHVQPILLGDIINNVSWAVMITGESIVLYSRLGIIYHNDRVLRIVLIMILANGSIFYILTTIVHYGTYSSHSSFSIAAPIIEKIQMTAYSIQELIISGIYVCEVIRYNRIVTASFSTAEAYHQQHQKQHASTLRTIWELFIINVIIITMDIALLTLEYCNFRVLQQSFKGLAYSFKLKMEFAILGKLVDMAKAGMLAETNPNLTMVAGRGGWHDGGTGSGPERSKSDVTHASFV